MRQIGSERDDHVRSDATEMTGDSLDGFSRIGAVQGAVFVTEELDFAQAKLLRRRHYAPLLGPARKQLDVEVPATWSLNATNILAQKYFRGTPGTPERETSLKQVADRVVDTITAWGVKDGYFADAAEAETFRAAPSGSMDAGGGWLRVQLEQPGVLFLRGLGSRRAEGVAVAMFGHTGLGMLICR